MNAERRQIVFTKVKKAVCARKKVVRFNLNPHLERETAILRDLKLLKKQNYLPLDYSESDVQFESFLPLVPTRTVQLTEGDFA